MLSFLKIKSLKTWIGLRSQSPLVKNRLIWVQSLLTLWDIMNTWKLNDESAVDDVEENPTVENDSLEQQQEQATSKLPTETQLKRSTRELQPSKRYTSDEHLFLSNGGELENYQGVLLHDEKKEWLRAMHEEMKFLHKNNTYELMELPKGEKALKNKWVLKRKSELNRSQPKYKTRLVVKGFSQKKGIDFKEIFSPVVKMSSIRVVLGLVASINLEIEQIDVKTIFFHGDLEEEMNT
ncbi:hypothetical protein PVL29_006516 [Vitis rotundifolia]|uniref:Reverse transcriptase Ty1/copia-type domain-containing protein n=1 Tax=Vitis rotundifolia TaxID=103349 RepID=A0AA39A5E0_VITRO|nr:hypothetical protein PVL29_006516 [Vitis rotundifolia]